MMTVDQFILPYTTCAVAAGCTDAMRHGWAFGHDGLHIVQVRVWAPPLPDAQAAAGGGTGKDQDDVAADAGDLLGDDIAGAGPTAIMAITAAMPIMMPSMVRKERILLVRSARRAIFRVCGRSMLFQALYVRISDDHARRGR